jgi:hypothetical protein
MTRDQDFASLDLAVLDAVTGGAGPLLRGRAAEQVYDALRTRAAHGDRRVTKTDSVSGIAHQGSVAAGSLSCESLDRPNQRRRVTCDLAPLGASNGS